MDARDRNKLLGAGFRIFRKREEWPVCGTGKPTLSIWEYTGSGWKKHAGGFTSLAERDRAWKELMLNEKHIGESDESNRH